VKVGDLVKLRACGNGRDMIGFVMRIDEQYYGSSTAYKVSQVERGKAIRSDMVDFIGYTADGIRDRVLVLWSTTDWEYCESPELEVVSECESR